MKYDLKKEISRQIYGLLLEETGENKDQQAIIEPAEDKKPEEKETKKTRKKGMQPGTISTAGAFGTGGRAKQFVADAKSRSQADPEGLMKDLKIENASGSTDLQRCLSVINQSIHLNELMSMAYQGATIDYVQEAGKKQEAILITPDQLDVKNGIRFMALVLDGAKNAGLLTIENVVQFKTIGGQIGIVSIEIK